jgi:hypothetical protein
MTQEAMKQMYQLLLTEPHAPTVCAQLERIAREALAEHAMSEVQRLGQEIEPKIGCVNHDCDQCKAPPEQEPVAIKRMKEWIEYLKRKSDFGQHMKIPSEMSAGTCWELAIELEQFINTTPPQRTEQEPVAMRMPKIGDKVICIEDDSLGEVAYLTAGGSPEIKFDDDSHGTYLLREFAELFRYATPPQRTWVGLTDEELLEIYGWRKAPMLSDFIVEEAKQELLGALRKVEAKLKEKNT